MPWRCGCANLEASDEEVVMNRLMIVAKLREDAYDEAEILLREGPPFDPEAFKLERHAAYLTAGEVVFVFEGPEVEWKVNELIDDPVISSFFAPWEKLVDGPPRIAHERFYWSRAEAKLGVGLGV
jgi:hypothetical protein